MHDGFQISDSIEPSVGRGAPLSDGLPVRGHVLLEVYGPDGLLKETRETDNLVVDAGEAHIADRLSTSPTGAAMGWMAIGTGATAAAFGNTALGAEIDRNALTSATDSANIVTYVGELGGGRWHQRGDHRGGDLQRRLDGDDAGAGRVHGDQQGSLGHARDHLDADYRHGGCIEHGYRVGMSPPESRARWRIRNRRHRRDGGPAGGHSRTRSRSPGGGSATDLYLIVMTIGSTAASMNALTDWKESAQREPHHLPEGRSATWGPECRPTRRLCRRRRPARRRYAPGHRRAEGSNRPVGTTATGTSATPDPPASITAARPGAGLPVYRLRGMAGERPTTTVGEHAADELHALSRRCRRHAAPAA